jgi:putative oxygen-independent coproporphyrinogen III oxidase
MALELPPLALYVHIPWCVKKCPYCDFNSHAAGHNALPEEEYVSSLVADLQQDCVLAHGRKLDSIFFGGGTPSLFSPLAIENIILAAQQTIGFVDNIEITLEANPGTFEQEKFRGFNLAGINRLSIGIQSFDDQQLQKLGRIHSGDDAIRAVLTAQKAGFDNINLDLMYGLPAQKPSQALADIDQAISLAPTHLSWYQLTIEPNTVFYHSAPTLPLDTDIEITMEEGLTIISKAGYQRYEVSAFAKPGCRASHNINYWQFGDYLGIGAGAHGKITLLDEQQVIRTRKSRLPRDYLDRKHKTLATSHVVATEELPVEFFMNALRLSDGVPSPYFTSRTGVSFHAIKNIWEELESQNLVTDGEKILATTPLGFRYLNSVLAHF